MNGADDITTHCPLTGRLPVIGAETRLSSAVLLSVSLESNAQFPGECAALGDSVHGLHIGRSTTLL